MAAPKITAYRDWQCLRLYINDLLHLELRMENHDGMQSWYEGSFNSTYCIEFYRKEGNPILLQYDEKETWKTILQILNEKI